jgi:hypothetical protein
MKLASLLIIAVLAALPTGWAQAATSGADPATQRLELPSVLVITKSSNKNQVHYAARVDDTCAPAGKSPVRPYWLMLERGPGVIEPLSEGEQRVLGLEHQEVTPESVQFALRGMPARTFTVHTSRAADGRCASWIEATIDGVPARVASVFVQQKLFGVDYVLLSGVSEAGATVCERVRP